MSGCRQTFSIWFYIKKVIKPYSRYFGRWKCFKELMKLRIDNSYFWHDSFGKYLNRWILCPIIGHRRVQWLSDGSCSNERPMHYCFNCETEVDPGIDRIKNPPRLAIDPKGIKPNLYLRETEQMPEGYRWF